jgi:hypothetical protein
MLIIERQLSPAQSRKINDLSARRVFGEARERLALLSQDTNGKPRCDAVLEIEAPGGRRAATVSRSLSAASSPT